MIAAVLVSMALMIVDYRQHHLHTLRSALSVVMYPLHLVANSPHALGVWLSDTLVTREQLQEDNAQLRDENLRLRVQQQKLAALEEENIRLRDLLGSSFEVGDRVLIAEIYAVDLDPYKQQVMIDKGSDSGVYRGQAVLDANAVLGQVVQVNPSTSQVLMITDASHSLPVQVNRNGLRSIALGTGRTNELELAHLPNNSDIKIGDLLVTSGLGGHFPAGYPVAEVTSVERIPGKPFARVLARPSAHLDRIREVLLVWALKLPKLHTETPPETAPTEAKP